MAEPTLEEFEAEVRAWLDANATRKAPTGDEKFVWGEGSDALARTIDRAKELEELKDAKAWRAKKFDAGYGWIHGPEEYGGRGYSSAHTRVFNALEAEYDVPSDGFFGIGLGMVAPVILVHGQPATKEKYLKALHRGDLVACQLFSEPGAGSDLASLSTRAERDGDEWVFNGQKVWNTGGHFSDIGLLVARSDVNQPKHKGITAFILDMHGPGVEVRPLRQMTGGAEFNEVFMTDARTPDDHRLDEVNEGWRVAITTLMNERSGASRSGGSKSKISSMDRLTALLSHVGKLHDPVMRDKLMDLHIHQEVSELLAARLSTKIRGGVTPGPEMSMTKLYGARNTSRAVMFVAEALGPRILADTGEWGTYAWAQPLLSSPSSHIAGGSDQVMQNILGERVLGLPKDVGIDVTSPFNEIKVGTQRS